MIQCALRTKFEHISAYSVLGTDALFLYHDLCGVALSENDIPEADAKNLMIEILTFDLSNVESYYAILDKCYDPDVEIQRLAYTMNVNVQNHIENSLMAIYDEGDIST